jgi:hypothetical protein
VKALFAPGDPGPHLERITIAKERSLQTAESPEYPGALKISLRRLLAKRILPGSPFRRLAKACSVHLIRFLS